MLHDAFLKFDYSRTGMLSLDEVYGAFEWLKIPVTPEEVLFFVRSVSRDPRLPYNPNPNPDPPLTPTPNPAPNPSPNASASPNPTLNPNQVSREDHVSYNDFMDLLCPPEGEAEDWALLGPPAESHSAAAPPAAPPGVRRQLSRVQPKGGGELAQLAQAQDREEAEVEQQF
jgi:hypothetical protein